MNATTVALKEWAVVDEALAAGDQTILLRKGGLADAGGVFTAEHEAFLIYPTYLHQNPALVKPAYRDRFAFDRPDQTHVTIRTFVQVVDTLAAPPTPDTADAWSCFHIYSDRLIQKRYAYKPQRPLLILIVRAFRLAEPASVEETPTYAGCRSWVTLDEPASTAGARPVLDDDAFLQRAAEIQQAVTTVAG